MVTTGMHIGDYKKQLINFRSKGTVGHEMNLKFEKNRPTLKFEKKNSHLKNMSNISIEVDLILLEQLQKTNTTKTSLPSFLFFDCAKCISPSTPLFLTIIVPIWTIF
jgi:hypothetical protein